MMSKERPLRVLTGIGGIRDIVVGTGFVWGVPEVVSLQLYQNFNQLLFGISAPFAGWIFLLAGIIALIAAVKDWPILAKYALWAQSLVWLFSGLMYLLAGQIFQSIVFGFLSSLPAAYIAVVYKYRVSWERERIELRKELEELREMIKGT